ncbi:MAG: DUF4349 domain-containing protein [Solirubrobacteraceae bacterium]|nr:DUF4349 domain-containing protein [Solirubrobacteraceae bacterium]
MSLLHRTDDRHDDLPELTPEQLAELDALDAALLGDEIADDALATLVRDVRAAAPELGTEGTQTLNDRLGVTLDPAAGRKALRSRLRPGGLLHGPGAVAATMLVVVALGGGAFVLTTGGSESGGGVLQSLNTGDDSADQAASAPSAGSAMPEERAETVLDAGGASSSDSSAAVERDSAAPSSQRLTPSAEIDQFSNRLQGATVTTPRGPVDADRTAGRAVERSVDLTVRVKNGGLPDAGRKVASITRRSNGYVASSEMNLGAAGAGTATFVLRVDSPKLDETIDRLSGLGTVTGQSALSQDITGTLDSAKQQLADARKAREALLKALSKATTEGEIASLRARIAANRRELARFDAGVRRVERRADLTTITLSMDAPAKGDPTADDGSWSLGDAADDAWSALRAILGGLLVAAAVIAPFALIGGAGYAVWSRRRRAARERTLDT